MSVRMVTPLAASAIGNAPVTSASPPVLISGNISGVTDRTCMRLWYPVLQLQLVDHVLRDQADALFRNPETLGVENRVFANHQPFRYPYTVVDDDALQLCVPADMNVGQHDDLFQRRIGVDARAGEDQAALQR